MHACECFPLNTALRTVRQTSQAFSRMRVHIYNLSDGVNGQLFPLNPFNSERVCFSFLVRLVAGCPATVHRQNFKIIKVSLAFFWNKKKKQCQTLRWKKIFFLMFMLPYCRGNDEKRRDWRSHTHVTPIPISGGMPAMGEKEGGQGCESLRGMGSGILLVMYYTPRALGKGVGGVQLWVCANIVTVPKRWALETTPLYLWESRLWENQIQVCRLATGRNA